MFPRAHYLFFQDLLKGKQCFSKQVTKPLNLQTYFSQSVSLRVCVRESHACVQKSKCEGGAKLHEFVRVNVHAFMIFWVHHTRAITLEIFL